jgi:hypothetical protein
MWENDLKKKKRIRKKKFFLLPGCFIKRNERNEDASKKGEELSGERGKMRRNEEGRKQSKREITQNTKLRGHYVISHRYQIIIDPAGRFQPGFVMDGVFGATGHPANCVSTRPSPLLHNPNLNPHRQNWDSVPAPIHCCRQDHELNIGGEEKTAALHPPPIHLYTIEWLHVRIRVQGTKALNLSYN